MFCNGCGQSSHNRSDCLLKDHPDFNKKGEWNRSDSFKRLKTFKNPKSGKIEGTEVLPFQHLINGRRWEGAPKAPENFKKKNECKYNTTLHTIYDEYINPLTQSCIVTNNNTLYIDCLFDTGALQDNYIDTETADWLASNGAIGSVDNKLVCSAFSSCETKKRKFSINFNLKKL